MIVYEAQLIAVFGTDFDLYGQISDVCSFGTDLAGVQYSMDVVVGEFCGAQTDCLSMYGFSNGRHQVSKWIWHGGPI